MATSLPLIFLISESLLVKIFVLFTSIFPLNSTFPALSKPMMADAVTLFPDPDSPTTAKVSPSDNEKLKLSTARTNPSEVLNETFKFSTFKISLMLQVLLEDLKLHIKYLQLHLPQPQ